MKKIITGLLLSLSCLYSISGTYSFTDDKETGNTITLKKIKGNMYSFDMSVSNTSGRMDTLFTGELSGKIRINNGIGRYIKQVEGENSLCEFQLIFKQVELEIRTLNNNQDCGFGMNVGVDGDYYYASYSVIKVASDDILNVRKSASSKSKVIGTFNPWDDNIDVFKCKPNTNWCLAGQYEGDFSGWVNKKFLKGHTTPIFYNQYSSNKCSVQNVKGNDTLSLRQFPRSNSKKVGVLKYNANDLIAYSERNNWVFVKNNDGISGWANKRFLNIEW